MDTRQQRCEHVELDPENESIICTVSQENQFLNGKIVWLYGLCALIKAIRFALKRFLWIDSRERD